MKKLYIGTSGWSYKDWQGVFYSPAQKREQYLRYYAQNFHSVEIDSTFYGIPRLTTVQNWFEQTPEDFVFCPKVPQVITHEKRLKECAADWQKFTDRMQTLKHKLGPIVLQFDYKFTFAEHFENLKQFLNTYVSHSFRLAVEIRNRKWYRPEFFDLLKKHGVALVLNDLYYMPRRVDLTADFTYIRLLGNRKQIPDVFSHVRVDRNKELAWWTSRIKEFLDKELEVYVYSNNRYQGHAPATIKNLQERLFK